MSRFLSSVHAALTPYTPGEQPRDQQYTKLNTNESPFPPSPRVRAAAAGAAGSLNLYNDPACTALREAAARLWGVKPENIMPVNGSDEILYFAFLTFCDGTRPIAFPDISYGFYPVYADLMHIPAHIIPLREDFSVDPEDYAGLGENIVIANPNAPTGMALSPGQIETVVRSNPDNVVIIDEAYVDFGAESCVGLISKYDNLLVTRTFSKSPYNVNSMTQAAGAAAIADDAYYEENCRRIEEIRAYAAGELIALGFEVLPSKANFLFARSPDIPGGELYRKLKERGVLVRWFASDRIRDFTRITVGTRRQMDILLDRVRNILEERGANL